jgi:hypothetical protein
VIGGGKFSNGAALAGFGYLFNQAISRRIVGDLKNALQDPQKALELRKGLAAGAYAIGTAADAGTVGRLLFCLVVAPVPATISFVADLAKFALEPSATSVAEMVVPAAATRPFKGTNHVVQGVMEGNAQVMKAQIRPELELHHRNMYRDDWRQLL